MIPTHMHFILNREVESGILAILQTMLFSLKQKILVISWEWISLLAICNKDGNEIIKTNFDWSQTYKTESVSSWQLLLIF